MNPACSEPFDPTRGAGRSLSGGTRWPRPLIAGAVGLTVLQTAAFIWLARLPDASRAPSPAPAQTSLQAARILLAVDGLQEAQSWLPDPRPFLSQPPGAPAPSSLRPIRIDLTASSPLQASRFLPIDAAPPPISPVIPRPPLRAADLELPRPPSPPTQPLALTSPQISISGALQTRPLKRPITVPPWNGPEALGVTRVEVSVNTDGEVVLARIVESCGVKAADLQVLEACRAARFARSAPVPPGQEFLALTRGRIAHRWPTQP